MNKFNFKANTLAFCFIELGRNPHILQKYVVLFSGRSSVFVNTETCLRVKEEVDRVIGERQIINFQDIAELKYCSGAFKEALRLWPPVPVLGRRITEKMNIDGQEIPADTFVIVSLLNLYLVELDGDFSTRHLHM